MFLRFDDPVRAVVLTESREDTRSLLPDGTGWTERWTRLDFERAYDVLSAHADRSETVDAIRTSLPDDDILHADDDTLLRRAAERFRFGWLVEIDRIAPSGGWRGEEPKPAETHEEAVTPEEKPTGVPAKKERDHWITVKLVGENGEPIPNEACRITDPAGDVHDLETDSNGETTVSGIPEGNCDIEFPELDKEAWEALENG